MKILYGKEVIELTKGEAKQAQIYGSEMYKALLDARHNFPTFEIRVKSAAPKRDNYKGLTREFMKKYIADNDDELHTATNEFNTLCGLDEKGNKKAFAAVASYGELRMWFLNKYPELSNMQDSIKVIMERVRKERAA